LQKILHFLNIIMLLVKNIRDQKEKITTALSKRGWNAEQLSILDRIISKDDERKSTQKTLDNLLEESNLLSAEIGNLYKSGQKEQGDLKKVRVSEIKDSSKDLKEKLESIELSLEEDLLSVPNSPHESVPNGKSADDNEVFRAWDKDLPVLPLGSKPHWELANEYSLFDLELGVKLTGAGFPVYRGFGAKLERALINFFLDQASEAGYEEIMPPILVNEASARGTGQIPDKEAQMYYVEKDDLYLIPTAEVPVTNILRDQILNENQLPIKMTAYTPCFRREAGSYGAHVRGLNRVHQFNKVEIVQIEHPDKSYDALMVMVDHVAKLLNMLELPFRILRLCGGDMGSASALTFDFEVYSAAQEKWLEVSSVSNFESFQTNRMKLRFRDSNGKIELAHSLNGSALALARIVASLIENKQTPDGIVIPEVLRPYTGFSIITKK
jgi:seryl-tRNA synthetase